MEQALIKTKSNYEQLKEEIVATDIQKKTEIETEKKLFSDTLKQLTEKHKLTLDMLVLQNDKERAADLEVARNSVEKLDAALKSRTVENQSLKDELSTKSDIIQTLHSEESKLITALTQAQNENYRLQESLKNVEANTESLKLSLSKAQQEYSTVNSKLVDLQAIVKTCQAQLTDSLATKKQLQDQISYLQSQCLSKDEKEKTSNDSILKLQKTNQALEENMKTSKAKMKLKVAALHAQETAIHELETRLKSEQLQNSHLSREIELEKSKRGSLEEQLESIRYKLTESQKIIESNEQVISYLNNQLTDRDSKTFSTTNTQRGQKILSPKTQSVLTEKRLLVQDFPIRSASTLMTHEKELSQPTKFTPVAFTPRLLRSD
jgi:chromosome segregation ATPase